MKTGYGYISAILLLFTSFCSFSQQSTQLPISSIRTNISPEQLQQHLDSATNESYIPFHARYFSLENNKTPVAEIDAHRLWNFKKPGFDIRVFLNIKFIPNYDTIYIKNSAGEIVETIHRENLIQRKWSSLTYSEQIVVEHRHHSSRNSEFTFEGYSLQPKSVSGTEDFGDAGPCEVNINCPEGNNYQDVKNSVVRIRARLGSLEAWCSGTVMLTTAYDYRPYILTAEHCGYAAGNFTDPQNLENWEFYFNYEASDCSTPASEAQVKFTKLIGAELVARSEDDGGDYGSDFLLMELQDETAFAGLDRVFFAGWDRSGNPPRSGVTIHHPVGDIKKISTFSATPVSSEIGPDIQDTHWEVNWIATTTNHGVTEFGSSGSPLLSSRGLVFGVLTGGFASCNNLLEPDYFGKLSYSWESNGTATDRQLAPWLDPVNSGVLALPGSYRDTSGIPQDTTDFYIRNPATDTLSIHGLKQLTEETEVQIFSLSGELLYRDKVIALPNIAEEIDVSNYPSSMFIVRLVGKSETRHYKVVILNL